MCVRREGVRYLPAIGNRGSSEGVQRDTGHERGNGPREEHEWQRENDASSL